MKLRTKFSVFVNVAVWVTTGVLIFGCFQIITKFLEESGAEAQRLQTMNWQLVCRDALAGDDIDVLIRHAQIMASRPEIDYVYLYGEDGTILAHTFPRFIGLAHLDFSKQIDLDATEASIPLHVKGKQSRAVVGFSNEFKRKKLRETLLILTLQILVLAGFILAVSVFGSGLFADSMTKQLDQIIEASKEIEKGNFSVKVPETAKDEFGALAKEFNLMSEKLSVLDQIKDGFISAVSHDLRAPLSAIIMWIEHLTESDKDKDKILPAHREFLLTIKDLAKRLNVYVVNVLNAAQIKAGRVSYHMQAVSLRESVETSIKVFDYMAAKRKITVEMDIPEDLPKLSADKEHLDHAISNLVGNALKFTPPGGTVRLQGRSMNGDVEIVVTDTGAGIPEDQISGLFDAFVQVDVKSQKEKGQKGTGLGLYIVKQHVDGMKGSIRVESKVGEGTRFTLKFPRAP